MSITSFEPEQVPSYAVPEQEHDDVEAVYGEDDSEFAPPNAGTEDGVEVAPGSDSELSEPTQELDEADSKPRDIETQLTAAQQFISRQGNEIGVLRHQLTQLHNQLSQVSQMMQQSEVKQQEAMPEISPDEMAERPVESTKKLIAAAEAERERRAAQQQQQFQNYVQKQYNDIVSVVPDFPSRVLAISQMLTEEDGLSTNEAVAFIQNPYVLPARTLADYSRRLYWRERAIAAEQGKQQPPAQRFAAIEKSARSKPLASGQSNGGASTRAGVLHKPIERMTNQELDDFLKANKRS